METYRPIPYRQGCKILAKWDEDFDDGEGHTAIVTKVNYINPKGKTIKGYILYTKWNKNEK